MGTAIVGWVATAITAVTGASQAVATALAQIVVGVGTAAASQMLFRPNAPRSPRQQLQVTINQASGDRIRGYGKMRLAGTRAFFDAKEGRLYQVIVFHHGEAHAIDEIRIGDISVEMDGDGWVTTEPFTGNFVRIEQRLGDPDQTVFTLLNSAYPSDWTSDYRLRGLVCLYVAFVAPKLEFLTKIFPQVENTPIRIDARLSEVYDPREETTGYSTNPALFIRDYLRHPDGYRLADEDIDDDSFAAFADICDALVDKVGGTQPRYTGGGTYSLQEAPKDVLARLCATCDARVYLNADGKAAIRGGVWPAPAVTLTIDNIIGAELEQGSDRFAVFNTLRTLYTDPAQDYQLVEAPRWADMADVGERGEIPGELELGMVQDSAQAQRLAKIFKYRQNPAWKGTIRTDVSGLDARYEPTIQVVIPELSIDEAFSVEDHGIILEGGTVVGCEITIASLPSAAYEWDPDTEEGVNPIAAPVESDTTVETPTILTVAVEFRSIGVSTTAPVVVVTVDEPARQDLTIEGQIRLQPSGPWEAMASSELQAVSNVVIDGEDYDVRVRWRTAGNTAGPWAEDEITISL